MTRQESAGVLTDFYNWLTRSLNYEESQGGKPDRKLAEALLVAIKELKEEAVETYMVSGPLTNPTFVKQKIIVIENNGTDTY